MALGVNDHQALASSHRPLTDSLNKYSSADKLICIQSVCYKVSVCYLSRLSQLLVQS